MTRILSGGRRWRSYSVRGMVVVFARFENVTMRGWFYPEEYKRLFPGN